jgi:hypothetical protein
VGSDSSSSSDVTSSAGWAGASGSVNVGIADSVRDGKVIGIAVRDGRCNGGAEVDHGSSSSMGWQRQQGGQLRQRQLRQRRQAGERREDQDVLIIAIP